MHDTTKSNMPASDGSFLRPSALLTDLYQLTMLDAYYRLDMQQLAVFEFFVRRLPDARNFLVAAGLDQVLEYLEDVHFSAEEIEWLASTRGLRRRPVARLRLQAAAIRRASLPQALAMEGDVAGSTAGL
jgi:nicotinic acid phosphoribosyltransferase